MRLFIALPAIALLSACGGVKSTPEPIIVPQEVVVPVAIGCVPANMSAPPVYPDTDDALKAAIDAAERYQLLYAGRKVRVARLSEIEPVIATCPKSAAK